MVLSTAPSLRHLHNISHASDAEIGIGNEKGQHVLCCPFFILLRSRNLEREKSLELSTSTLARLRSTN